MKIYGVALLAACFLLGQLIGIYLGILLGIGGNVGGVGIGMVFLILANDRFLSKSSDFITETNSGIYFWSSMYIPIVIAMAATLNVKAAISGGWVAVIAGIGATAIVYLFIPSISRLSKFDKTDNAN